MNGAPVVFCVTLAAIILGALNYDSIRDYYIYADRIKNAELDMQNWDVLYRPVNMTEAIKWTRGGYDASGSVYSNSIGRITPVHDGSVRIDFSHEDVGPPYAHAMIPKFSHAENIRENQTFAVMCVSPSSETQKYLKNTTDAELHILKYLGTEIRNGTHVFKFFHATAAVDGRMPCDYPEVIQYSVDAVHIDLPAEFEEIWNEKASKDRKQLERTLEEVIAAALKEQAGFAGMSEQEQNAYRQDVMTFIGVSGEFNLKRAQSVLTLLASANNIYKAEDEIQFSMRQHSHSLLSESINETGVAAEYKQHESGGHYLEFSSTIGEN